MLKVTITDTDWTIAEQAATYMGEEGVTAEVAREFADTQEAWLITNSFGRLPKGWSYEGDGVWAGPSPLHPSVATAVAVIRSMQVEASDYALQAMTLETLAP